MKIIDSHCHPQFPQYEEDREEMIKRTLDGGIQMICVGTDLEMSKKAIELAQKHDGIWATVGLHPNDNLNEDFNGGEYEELLKMPKVVAMGEIGLDYYRTAEPEEQKIQKDKFLKQLELADKMSKPIILHCRDSKAGSTGKAYPQMADILKNGYVKNGGVVHSYTGSLEEAKQFLNLGLYLGFNGIITFARQYDDIIKYIPLDRMLLETDAPYLTPEPHRGKRNESLYAIEVVKKIALLRGESVEDTAAKTLDNTIELFKLKF
ncbi:MAG: TatD family hydrolase [Candidatus Yanofskybacteria bacterium]|nr:TatD family hydrolase [Candidatus Yanofskybacteria bacterium]